jgi:hypothetical protein
MDSATPAGNDAVIADPSAVRLDDRGDARAGAGAGPGAAPLPVIPVELIAPPPLPVQMPTPPMWRPTRPARITAIGILSILIACLSGMACIATGIFLSVAVAAVTMAKIPPATFSPPASGAVDEDDAINEANLPEDGLGKSQRDLIVAALSRIRPMDQARRRQLDKLLATDGQAMFPFAADGASPSLVRNNVSASGVIPSPHGGSGPHYFVVGQGRIEVYDDHALFRPDGPGEVVSVSAPAPAEATPAQAAPTAPDAAGAPTAPMPYSRSGYRTSTSLRVGNKSMTVTQTPGGTTATAGGTTAGGAGAVGPGGAGAGAGVNPFAGVSISPWAMTLTSIDAALSALLAMFLLIGGIMMLGHSRSARRLHWIYVVVKIPLAIMGGIGLAFMICQFTATLSSSAAPWAPSDTTRIALGVSVLLALLGVLYPLVLIIELRSKKVREYYNAWRA